MTDSLEHLAARLADFLGVDPLQVRHTKRGVTLTSYQLARVVDALRLTEYTSASRAHLQAIPPADLTDTVTCSVDDLRDLDDFTLDGGQTWYVHAGGGCWGVVAVYDGAVRGEDGMTIRIPADPTDECLRKPRAAR